MALWVIPDVRD